jgi:hypothetical protein
MATVFIGGSRQISRLPAEVKTRLDAMIEKGVQILVGDANGRRQGRAAVPFPQLLSERPRAHEGPLPEQRRELANA